MPQASTPNPDDETYSEAETATRMEAGLRRALATPHKPQEKIGRRPERRTFKKAEPK